MITVSTNSKFCLQVFTFMWFLRIYLSDFQNENNLKRLYNVNKYLRQNCAYLLDAMKFVNAICYKLFKVCWILFGSLILFYWKNVIYCFFSKIWHTWVALFIFKFRRKNTKWNMHTMIVVIKLKKKTTRLVQKVKRTRGVTETPE